MTQLVYIYQEETWAQHTSLWDASSNRTWVTNMVAYLDGLVSIGKEAFEKFQKQTADSKVFQLIQEYFDRDSVECFSQVQENSYTSTLDI